MYAKTKTVGIIAIVLVSLTIVAKSPYAERNMVRNLSLWFSRCSDCLLHPEYEKILNKLYGYQLTQEIIDFLCDKATSNKHFCKIRFEHLKILLLNKSALKFDLKEFNFVLPTKF